MGAKSPPWAIVLAGGDGTRLRSLTLDADGDPVPKQYCSLAGGDSLLRLAMLRASRATARGRIVTIVASDHEGWWRPELDDLPPNNIVVQPRNLGTAPGILLPVLRVMERDPDATFVVLPSDHFVLDESVLELALQRAIAHVAREPEAMVLLGMTPDELDTQFGWIVPSSSEVGAIAPVDCFVEKPSIEVATELLGQGGVWNSFIFAASGKALLRLYEKRLPGLYATLHGIEHAFASCPGLDHALHLAYETMDTSDFCRDLLQGEESVLRVLTVPPCGWSDLGTAERVLRCLERAPRRGPLPAGVHTDAPVPLSLDHALARRAVP